MGELLTGICSKSIKVCSYNMHGFKNGVSTVQDLCLNYDIILLQEHWLLKANLNKIGDINVNFQAFCLSSMNAKAAAGILVGRPFGGVAVLWRKSLSNRITILESDDAEGKFLSIKLAGCGTKDLVITCVYLPCVTTSRDYIIASSSIISYIENILTNYADALHLIAGDFNFPCNDGNVGYDLFKDILTDYNLLCCDDKIKNNDILYTYIHESLDQRSWLDHFFVSKDLYDNVLDCSIIDSGVNLSDHLPISCELKITTKSCDIVNDYPSYAKSVYKERWDKANLLMYYHKSGVFLQSLNVPTALLHCIDGCKCVNHKTDINTFYDSIVCMLRRSTVGCVPKIPFKCLKPFWNDDLDKLKEQSLDMHKLWRQVGSPKQGIINAARIKAKFEYKQAIKQTASEFEQNNADALHGNLSGKNYNQFWKLWNAKYKKNITTPVAVEGETNPESIANKFKQHYSNVYVNSADNVNAFNNYHKLIKTPFGVNDATAVSMEAIEKCVKMLKPNKAAGLDGITAEHIINSHPCIIVYFKLLFTMMISHSFVPDAFGMGIVIPIVKDRCGDIASVDNYRPITLSPVISKVFESVLLLKYSQRLRTDDLQFGFKTGLGCSNAIFALRQVIEYFNDRGSNVYMAALDASKAFDRVNHFKLFAILIKMGLSPSFVNIIVNWYSKLFVVVRWNGYNSTPLSVLSGVRQGGILSPILFNVYVNCIISTLRNESRGCHVRNIFLGCIMYADDLLLLSASVLDLQQMLDSCGCVGDELGMKFNCKKSACMIIGPNKCSPISPMILNGLQIQWVDKIKYLGIILTSSKRFTVDHKETRRKFFVSVNTIFSKCKFTSDIVKLELLESQCLPILLYSIESLNLNNVQIKEINSWWNSVYRKIFGYNKWESVKETICLLGRLDVLHIVIMRRLKFIKRILQSDNSVMHDLMRYYLQSPELKLLEDQFSLKLGWSPAKITALTYVHFKSMFV